MLLLIPNGLFVVLLAACFLALIMAEKRWRRRHTIVTLTWIVPRSWGTIPSLLDLASPLRLMFLRSFLACWHIAGVLTTISHFYDGYWVDKGWVIFSSIRMGWLFCRGPRGECFFCPWLFLSERISISGMGLLGGIQLFLDTWLYE